MSYMSYEIIPARHAVQAWPKLHQLIGSVEANIAGGYAAWHMSNAFDWDRRQVNEDGHLLIDYHTGLGVVVPSNHPTDIDIFTYNDLGYNTLVCRLKSAGFKVVKESKYCTTWMDTVFLNEDNWSHLRNCTEISRSNSRASWAIAFADSRADCILPVQLIKPVFGKNPHEVLEHFDFYAAKFAILDGGTVLAHKDAIRCQDKRLLTHAHPDAILTNPFYVLGRAVKYAKKGYKVNYIEMLKMVTNAQAANVENVDVAQLQDIVQHFSQYLRSASLGRGEDFRPVFADAYGEWLRYILNKKS